MSDDTTKVVKDLVQFAHMRTTVNKPKARALTTTGELIAALESLPPDTPLGFGVPVYGMTLYQACEVLPPRGKRESALIEVSNPLG